MKEWMGDKRKGPGDSEAISGRLQARSAATTWLDLSDTYSHD